jgi:hypothetical protein
MIDQSQIKSLNEIIKLSKSSLLVFPETKNLDLIAAAYSFYYFLEGILAEEQKGQLRLLCPNLNRNSLGELKNLLTITDLQNEMGKENLLISFPYDEMKVDQVDSYLGDEGQRLFIRVKSKKGASPVSEKDVQFSYSGANADLLILLGVNDLENLDNLYYGYEDLYSAINNQVVTINNFLPDFGSLNLDISGRTSYSEAVFYLLKGLAEQLELDFVDLLAKTEIPTILLFGMEYKTRALASKQATAETFLAVGELLQMGARRVFVVEEKQSVAEVKNKNESVSKKKSVQTKTKKIEIKK